MVVAWVCPQYRTSNICLWCSAKDYGARFGGQKQQGGRQVRRPTPAPAVAIAGGGTSDVGGEGSYSPKIFGYGRAAPTPLRIDTKHMPEVRHTAGVWQVGRLLSAATTAEALSRPSAEIP